MMAIRIVTGAAEEHEAGPSAARSALFGVVTGPAKAPQIFDGAVAGVAQRRGALPNVLQRVVANVAAGPRFGRQRRATLDGAVGLDAERGATGSARRHVAARHRTLEQRFVRTKVADVVARPDAHLELVGAVLQRAEQREQLE